MTASLVDDNISANDEFDVVIVGAGLAGLTAAYSILRKRVGLRVLVLEKNGTAGGRIRAEKNSEAFYGNFCQKHIARLVNELEIPVERGRGANRLAFFMRDGLVTEEKSPLISCQVYYFLNLLQRLSLDSRFSSRECNEDSKKLAEMSINGLIHKTVYFSRARLLCESLIYACCGIENLEKVSVLWFVAMLQGAGGIFSKLSVCLGDDERFFVKGGFAFVVKELERRIFEEEGTIRTSESVLRIETRNESVFVSTSSIRFKCDYAVIAVPPPSSALINVAPALPGLFLESQKLYEFGKNVFFHATYKDSFWPSNTSDCTIITANSGANLRMTYDATHPLNNKIRTLAGFTSKWSDDSTPRSSIFGALKQCFGARKASRYIHYSVDDSTTGECGSPMSVLRPSSVQYHVDPTILSLERVIFAASEYAKKWPGTADGAIEAGETAAYTILYRARPQALHRDQIRDYADSKRTFAAETPPGIARTHLICLGLNVCLFFFLLRDAYEKT